MVFGKKHTDPQPTTTAPQATTSANVPPKIDTATMGPTTINATESNAPSVYHDAPDAIGPHDPSPKYEKNAPPFQPMKLTDEKPPVVDSKAVDFADNGADVKRNGTWGRGAGTYGPAQGNNKDHSRQPSLAERANTAATNLSDETRGKLSAKEKKDAKRLSKIIKAEGKAESKHFKSSLRELDHLQKRQKKASKSEQAAGKATNKAIKEEQKAEAAYHDAKKRLDRAIANKKSTAETLDMKKEHAASTTDQLNKQAHEVEAMRERKATDDREREAKLAQLNAALVASSKA